MEGCAINTAAQGEYRYDILQEIIQDLLQEYHIINLHNVD